MALFLFGTGTLALQCPVKLTFYFLSAGIDFIRRGEDNVFMDVSYPPLMAVTTVEHVFESFQDLPQLSHLLLCQIAALEVGHQTVRAAGDVPYVETHRTEAMGRGPDLDAGKVRQIFEQILPRLLEGIQNRRHQRMYAGDGAAEPGFGQDVPYKDAV